MADDLLIASLAERPDLAGGLWGLGDLWAPFMHSDPTADLYYGRCERLFADLVIVAVDPAVPGRVEARGFAVPFALRGDELPADGWDAVIRWGLEDAVDGRPATHVSALEITIRPEHRGAGLASRMIDALRSAATARGAAALVAPVRPSEKHLEPMTPMAEYVGRTRPDGLPADAWLRTHVRAGGTIGAIAPRSMTIAGSLASWREWTGAAFDRSGPVVVDGALVPVLADVDRDLAVYVEPNVWVTHSLA